MPLDAETAHSYHEPPIIVILAGASMLLPLDVLGWTLDAALCCGLVGQILHL